MIAAFAVAMSCTRGHVPGIVGADDPRASEVAALVGTYHELGQFDGVVLVADAGKVVYRGAFGLANREWNVAHTLDSRFEVASITKPITAIAVLQLVDEGKLRLDAPIGDYVPYFRGTPGAAITIDQLLVHRSGLQQDIAFAEPGDDPCAATRINADQLSIDDMVRLIAARPLRFSPGTEYAYSSDGYAVLGDIVERVTGKSYYDAVSDRVLRRAGMAATVPALLAPLVPHRVIGYQQSWDALDNSLHVGPSPAGGLYATADDLYAWARTLDGDPLLSARMRQLVFAKHDAITAYGWKIREDTRRGQTELIARTTGGLPGFVHVLERIPAEGRVVIVLCNVRSPAYYLDHLVDGLHAVLDGRHPEAPRRSAAIEAARAISRGPAAVRADLERMAADAGRYYLEESEINALGYHSLSRRRDPRAAVAIFAFNAHAFPRSVNVYDSLGEAELAVGDRGAAIRDYRKVLELDPHNRNAAKMLERLGVTAPPGP